MTDSDIDTSCHIPYSEPVLTPERMAKGDLVSRSNEDSDIRFWQAQVRNILNYLWEIEAISEQNLYDAGTFQIWQKIWKSAHGFERSNSSVPRGGCGDRNKELGYTLILKRLSKSDFNTIELSINTLSTSHAKWIAFNRREVYRGALERLSAILPPIRDRIDALEANAE